MNANQANRARIAERSRPSRPNAIAMLRRSTAPIATGPVKRTRAVKMTGAQRNSEGRRSEWSMTPYVFTDPKWGTTVSTVS